MTDFATTNFPYLKDWGIDTLSLEEAKNLANLDGWHLANCPACKNEKSIMIFNETGKFHCESCHFHGDVSIARSSYAQSFDLFKEEKWFLDNIDNQSRQHILREWKLDGFHALTSSKDVLARKAYLSTPKKSAWASCLVIPSTDKMGNISDIISLGATEHLLKATQKSLKELPPAVWSVHGRRIPWGLYDQELDSEVVVLVLHPLDRMALIQAGITSVICLPDNLHQPDPENWEFLPELNNALKDVKRIITAFPDTVEGNGVGHDIARRFGFQKCYRVNWTKVPKPEGWKVMSPWVANLLWGDDGVEMVLGKAHPYPSASAQELIDVFGTVDYYIRNGIPRGVDLGLPTLDQFYSVKPGQSTMVYGIPNQGKTTLINNICYRLASRHGWRGAIFSPEYKEPARWFAEMVKRSMGRIVDDNNPIIEEDYQKANAFVQDHFKFIDPTQNLKDTDAPCKLEAILDEALTLVLKFGIRYLVIDPWNELDNNRPSNITEKEYLQNQLTICNRFMARHGVHIFIAVHPNKLEKGKDGFYPVPNVYQADNGAMWFNKMDNIICDYRHVGRSDQDIHDLHVQKIRYDEVGRPGLAHLSYHAESLRLIDDVNIQSRQTSYSRGEFRDSAHYLIEPRIANETEYMKICKKGKETDVNEWISKHSTSTDQVALRGWLANSRKKRNTETKSENIEQSLD
jgi:twinkle protein